jgi:hypothetical protein
MTSLSMFQGKKLVLLEFYGAENFMAPISPQREWRTSRPGWLTTVSSGN